MEKNTQIVLHHDLSKEVRHLLSELKVTREDVDKIINKRIDGLIKESVTEAVDRRLNWDKQLWDESLSRVITHTITGTWDSNKLRDALVKEIEKTINVAVLNSLKIVVQYTDKE